MTTTTTKFLTALATLLFFIAAGAHAQTPPDTVQPDAARQAAWQAFQTQNGAAWKVRWNEKTGTPASITSGETKPHSGTPKEAARSFLKANHRLF